MIQAVIFNLDGVLARTDICHWEAWKQLAHEQGLPFTADTFRAIAGRKRMDGLRVLLKKAERTYTPMELWALSARKNDLFNDMTMELGAKGIVAVDIDPDAVRVAKENVAHNGLESAIDVRRGDLLQGLDRQFDFAAANILAPVICLLAAPLRKHLTKGGRFICSGIIAEAEAEVNAALLDAGYTVDEIRRKGEWVAFACHTP